MAMRSPPRLPQPDRLRQLQKPFAWLPCRLLTEGFLAQMSPSASHLYLLLALAADRRGLSFYGDTRIQQLLGQTAGELSKARKELIDSDLLVFNGRVYQLLSLPSSFPSPPPPPIRTTSRSERPANSSHPDAVVPMPEEVRRTLRRLWSRR
jgi:hypothetical protein